MERKPIDIGDIVQHYSHGPTDWDTGIVTMFLHDGWCEVFYPKQELFDTVRVDELRLRLSWNKVSKIVTEVNKKLYNDEELGEI